MMDEQNRIINEALRSQSQMLNDAIKQFSENNPRMIINAIQQQAEIFNQVPGHLPDLFRAVFSLPRPRTHSKHQCSHPRVPGMS